MATAATINRIIDEENERNAKLHQQLHLSFAQGWKKPWWSLWLTSKSVKIYEFHLKAASLYEICADHHVPHSILSDTVSDEMNFNNYCKKNIHL